MLTRSVLLSRRVTCESFLLFCLMPGFALPLWSQATIVETEWVRQFGATGPVSVIAQGTDSLGNAYVAGVTGGSLTSADDVILENAGGQDGFIRKYDANGTEVWTRQLGSVPDDRVLAISVDATGVFVAGTTGGDLGDIASGGGMDGFVRRYDANGTVLWTTQIATSFDDQATAISVDETGVYVAGYTDGVLPGQVTAGGREIYVRKFDLNGVELWTREFGSTGNDQGMAISAQPSGVYVGGLALGALPGQVFLGSQDAFVRKYSVDGDELWTRQFGTSTTDQLFGVSADSSGVYVVGQTGGALPGQVSGGSLDFFVRKYDVAGTIVWTRQFPLAGIQTAFGVSVDATGVYVVGVVSGALPGQVSFGGSDAFVIKYDAGGALIWSRQFGSTLSEQANGVSVDASGIYVAGQTNGSLPGQTRTGTTDAFLRKYDLTGAVSWTRQFGTLGPVPDFAQAADTDGNIYVTGQTTGTFPDQVNAGLNDVFVRKYDVDGNEVWTREFGGLSDDLGRGIVADPSGVYIAGHTLGTLPGQTSRGAVDPFLRKYDADGNVVWTRQFGTTLLEQVVGLAKEGSNLYVAGYTSPNFPATTPADAFVYKYDIDGNPIWSRQIATSGLDRAGGIAADASGIYIAGFTDNAFPGQTNAGGQDIFVRKYDSNGVELWTRQIGSSPNDVAQSIAVHGNALYVGGFTEGSLSGEPNSGFGDAFTVRLDVDGNLVWARQLGTPGLDVTNGISVDDTGVFTAGYVRGPRIGQPNFGEQDAFARKYDVNGGLLWHEEFGTEGDDRALGIVADPNGIYVFGNIDNFPDAFVLKLLDFIDARIDIKPGTEPNSINLGSQGAVPVGIFSSPSFDATKVDPLSITLAEATVRLKGRGTPMVSFQDLNDDGLPDMLVHIDTEGLQLTDDATQAILKAKTFSGERVKGMDSVRIVP